MTEEAHGQAGEVPIPRHGLRWAIKTSFVGYVARMPDGRAFVGSGAAVTERNELVFPLEEHVSGDEHTFTFGGDVRFQGHYGLLFVRISRPRIVVRDGKAELTVDDPASKEGKRLPLVTFELTGPETEDDDTERWEAADVRLTPDGVELFGDVYRPGEPFDPLTVIAPRQGEDHG